MKSIAHSTLTPSHQVATVVFVDAGVDNYQQLVDGVIPTAEVFVLDGLADGIDQISQVLQQRQDIDAVHIVSHGAPGEIFIGRSSIALDDLTEFNVGRWQQSLSANAEILLYGCNVADGGQGRQFVKRLAQLTGAAVAASETRVGSEQKGGSWLLNVVVNATQSLQAVLAFDETTLNAYAGTFPLPGARSQTVGTDSTPEVFLGGNYIELGIDNDGTFGADNVPAGFFGRKYSAGVGIVSDTDGFDTGTDLRIDYFLPGTQEERFVSGYKIDGVATTGVASQSGSDSIIITGSDSIIITGITDTSSDSTLSAQVIGTLGSNLQITQNISFGVDDKFFKNTVTLTNIGGSTLDAVRFMRSFDPDNTVDVGGSFQTSNEVIGTVATEGYAAVRAVEQPGGPYSTLSDGSNAPIVFFSNDSRARGGFSTFGLIPPDLYAAAAYDSPQTTGYTSTGDVGMFLTFDVGTLVAGGSATFEYVTSLDGRDFDEVVDEMPTMDVNEAPTALSLSNNSIHENVAANTVVGTFSSTDVDAGDTFTYSLVSGTGDTDNTAFSIVGDQLQINASPDFETKDSYNIRVRTTDQGGESYEETLTINVNDIDETMYGTPNRDLLRGTASVDQINGLEGNDRLYGNAGNDTIQGGDGNDIVYGGDDNDYLLGGNGRDRLYGNAGNDTINGDAGNDILYGGAGDDSLNGGEGRDRLYGDNGNDILLGDMGNDILKGGAGDDLINGGAGRDRLYGGAGRDTFVLASGMGTDTIYDFENGVDLLQLDGGLSFGQLDIVERGSRTQINFADTGETLVTLFRTDATLITEADFTIA